METLPRILVTAAAGSTGSNTVKQLLKEGYPVTAMVRKIDSRSKELEQLGAKVITGSLMDIEDVRAALVGIDRAYFCAPFDPGYLRAANLFAIAAREAELDAIVVMSQWLANPRHPAPQTREAWMADGVFSMLPNTKVVTLNPGFFADNELQPLLFAKMFGLLMLPYGKGLNAAPSNEDMGRTIAALLKNPEPYAGKRIRPTGPKLNSPEEIASMIGNVLGRKVRYLNMPATMIGKVIRGWGYSAYMVAHYQVYAEEYQKGSFAHMGVNSSVEEITGTPAESYETTIRRYANNLPKNLNNPIVKLKWLMKLTLWTARPATKSANYLDGSDFRTAHPAQLSIESRWWRESDGLSSNIRAAGEPLRQS